jgi:transcriptional regulator with XRE-family HTH domain
LVFGSFLLDKANFRFALDIYTLSEQLIFNLYEILKINCLTLQDKYKLNDLFCLSCTQSLYKSSQMEQVSRRLKQIRNELGLTQESLGTHLGCTKNNISMKENGNCAITERDKSVLVQSFNINIEFLETGHGPMFNPIPPGRTEYPSKGQVPLYDLRQADGLKSLLSSPTVKPVGFITIPNLPECDGAVYFVGDGMYPILRSGDIALYQIIDTSLIIWGDMYLVSVSQGGREHITVCYLDSSPNPRKAVMRGAASDRSTTEVDIAKINAIALVKATIRMNTVK